MVNVRGPDPAQVRKIFRNCSPGTFLAEGLPQKLGGTEVIRPDGQRVPGVPIRRISAPPLAVFGPVLVAIPIAGQLTTARLGTGSKRLQRHGITSKAKQKTCTTIASQRYMAQALRRRLLIGDINDGLFAAAFAINGQVFGNRSWRQSQDLVLAAGRAHEPPSVCHYFTTVRFSNQAFSPRNFSFSLLIYTTSRLIFIIQLWLPEALLPGNGICQRNC